MIFLVPFLGMAVGAAVVAGVAAWDPSSAPGDDSRHAAPNLGFMRRPASRTSGPEASDRQGWPIVAVLLLAMLVIGCGEGPASRGRSDTNGTQTAAERPAPERQRAGERSDQPNAHVNRDEMFGLLREAGLRLQRVGGTGVAIRNIEPAPEANTRYAEKSGSHFDLLAFLTPADARRAEGSVRASRAVDDIAVGVNLVAAFPAEAGDEVRAKVAGVLQSLDDACGTAGGDRDLRRICFGGADESGGSSDRTMPRAVSEGSTERLGAFTYTVLLSRQLNPGIATDGRLLGGRRPAPGRQWFAVFLRVCNAGDSPGGPTGQFALVRSLGRRTDPEPLPEDGAFVPRPRSLEAGACVARTSTLSAARDEGAALIFDVPQDLQAQLPLHLEISAASERVWFRLDV